MYVSGTVFVCVCTYVQSIISINNERDKNDEYKIYGNQAKQMWFTDAYKKK